jgi:hypothetical protein
LAAFPVFRAKESYDWLGSPIKSLPALVQWMITGTGPMTTNAGEAAAFFRLDQTKYVCSPSITGALLKLFILTIDALVLIEAYGIRSRIICPSQYLIPPLVLAHLISRSSLHR